MRLWIGWLTSPDFGRDHIPSKKWYTIIFLREARPSPKVCVTAGEGTGWKHVQMYRSRGGHGPFGAMPF